uniref:Low-density lipoprotein receptor-related protein 6 n=1 Tax=Ascaris lumbricoides TaxID=6252 RepID=A0A0M3HPM8_ASCLU
MIVLIRCSRKVNDEGAMGGRDSLPVTVLLQCLEIPLVVRRQKSIDLTTVDTTRNAVLSTSTIVNGIDESFPVLMTTDISRGILAYMESWSRSSSDSIRVVSLRDNSSPSSHIHRSGGIVDETVTSMALEWVTGKLYVGIEAASVHNAGRIEVCSLEVNTSCAIVLHSSFNNPGSRVDALHSIVLDPLDGYMYWLNRVHKRIERAWMDGRHHDAYPFRDDTKDVVTTAALTLEQASRTLYYARTKISPDDSQIWSCHLYDRESCRIVATKVNAFYLDVFDNLLVWTSVTNQNSGITLCEKDDCAGTMRQIADSNGVEALRVLDLRSQPQRTSPNPCAVANGGCSHICVLIPGAPWRSCLCPIGVRLLEDRLTCAPNGTPLCTINLRIDRVLLVATTSGLISISLETKDYTPLPLPYVSTDTQDWKIMHVDYDPIDKKVYVIDGESGVIRRCKFDGSEQEEIIKDGVTPKSEALAVDWLNRNIYWLDSNIAQIKIQSLIGDYRQTVISHGLGQPRGLAIDPVGGYIYFSDWHESMGRIERAWLDGTHRVILIVLEEDAWPNGIAIDPEQDRIYWTEGRRSLIKSAVLHDGSDVTVFSSSVNHPYSLSKLGNTLYCNSLYGRKISAIRIPPQNETLFGERLAVISDSVIYGQMGIRAVSLNHVPHGHSACQINRGGCSHICVKLPNGSRGCMCPVGYELRADNATCVMPTAFIVYTASTPSRGIMRISLEKSPTNNHRINVANMTSTPASFDIDQSRQRLFWVAEGRGRFTRATLRSAFFNGSDVRTILEGVSINHLSIDWITGNIYWCNIEQRRIEIAAKDGHARRTIAWEELNPRHLAVHPTKLFFVFVNYFNPSRIAIHKAPLEGHRTGGPILIRDVRLVSALAIDFESELIVWSETADRIGTISVVDFNGANRAQLISNERFLPVALAVYQKKVYFANAKTNSIETYGGDALSVLHINISNVLKLGIAHGQTAKGWNECLKNNGGCSGICVATAKTLPNASVKCLCEDHFTLHSSTKKCLPPRKFLLIATRGRFIRFNLKRTPTTSVSWKDEAYTTLSVLNVGAPSSIGFDLFSPNRSIYWIDLHDDKFVKRASDLSTSVTHTISISRHSGCAILFALAVDELGRQLFVSCAEHGLSHASSIHVWRIKENDNLDYIGVVVSGRERSSVTDRPPYPRQIAVFPRLNLLFYVDVGGQMPVIVRCLLDGRQCVLWETPNLMPFVRMHANQANDRLYYTTANGLWSRDAHVFSDVRCHVKTTQMDAIDMAPISDTSMIVVAKNESQYEDLLLEAQDDVPTVSLEELKRDGLTTPISIRRILTLTVVGSSGVDPYDSHSHTCASSHCSHMCRIPRDSRRRHECLCPLGYGLQTPNGNLCFEHVSCAHWQFKCDDGQQCIHYASKCDGHQDCADGSDESQRWCRNVAVESWPCDDGKASIGRHLLCNGVTECGDGSDEAHCRCTHPAEQFDCSQWGEMVFGENECVSREVLCDGISNCYNSRDEDKQVCLGASLTQTHAPGLSPSFELMIPMVMFFVVLCLIVSACCYHFSSRRSASTQNASSAPLPLNTSAEARVLLPAHPDGTQVEFQLRTYSTAASSSLYNALPPPNSQISSADTNYQRSVLTGRSAGSSSVLPAQVPSLQKFCAPPPSAASLSTYGVVKPAGMKMRVDSRHRGTSSRRSRRRTKTKNHNPSFYGSRSPPPSYSQVRMLLCSRVRATNEIGDMADRVATTRAILVDRQRDCSEGEGHRAPVNSRIVSPADSSSAAEGPSLMRLSPHHIRSSSSSDVSLE